MKKSLALTAVGLTLVAAGLAGCSTNSSSGSTSADIKGQTLTILSNYTPGTPANAALKAGIAVFEKKTGAKVKLTTAAIADIPTQTESATLAGDEADLININPVENVRTWVKDGAAVAVDSYLKKWGLSSEVNASAVKQWQVGGKTIGFPYETFQWPLWFNMALLNKAGIQSEPTTLTDLESDVTKLNSAGITPMVVGGKDWTGQDLVERFIELYLPQSQYTSVFTDGKYCSNTAAMQGISELVKLRDEGLFAKNTQGLTYADMTTTFYTGKAAMMDSGSWSFAATPKSLLSSIKIGGIPAPASGGAVTKPAFAVGYTSSGYVVTKNGAKVPQLVKQFMQVMYSPAVVGKFVTTAGYVPAVSKVASFPSGTSPLLEAASKAVSATDRLPVTDPWIPSAVVTAYPQGSQLAYTPGKTAQDVCKAIETVYSSSK